jgi:hypothetical protein
MRGIRGEFTEPLGVLFRPVLTPERTNCTRHNNPSYVCMQAQHLPLHSLQRPDSRSKYFFRQMTLRKSVGPRPLVETRKSPHRGDHLEIYQRAKMPRPRCLLSPASFPVETRLYFPVSRCCLDPALRRSQHWYLAFQVHRQKTRRNHLRSSSRGIRRRLCNQLVVEVR